mmetsp:Transcript_91349/g.293389  ORF Transcript_91349/g.293389 Transcript_91349/m.293389 type:complete len:315 (+) Transcript_91349:316-1260(+)
MLASSTLRKLHCSSPEPPPPRSALSPCSSGAALSGLRWRCHRLVARHSRAPRPISAFEGRSYELVASKVLEEGPAFHGIRKHIIRSLYVAASAPGLENINIKTELEKIADFSALPNVRKVAARLELMLSTCSRKHVFQQLSADDFEVRDSEPMSAQDDPMCEGCGFIPEQVLHEMFGGSVKLGVQVRVFAPKLGIFKGVLCVKRGIDKILLPPSMRKVPRSTTCDDDWAALLVLNVYPSAASAQVGARLAGNTPLKHPPVKRLSPMVAKLWKNLEVPEALIKQLEKRHSRSVPSTPSWWVWETRPRPSPRGRCS